MTTDPNLSVYEIGLAKILGNQKGPTEGIQHLGLLMSGADPLSPQRCLVFGSKFLQIRARFPPGGKDSYHHEKVCLDIFF